MPLGIYNCFEKNQCSDGLKFHTSLGERHIHTLSPNLFQTSVAIVMQNFIEKKKKTEKPCRPIKFLQRGLQEICAFLFTMTITLICDHI